MGNKFCACHKAAKAANSTQNTNLKAEIYTTKPNKTKIGSYTIIEKLGRGGFGEVFLAKHSNTDKLFALKKVPLISLDMKERIETAEEASKIMLLKHANIISFQETFIENDDLIIVMEFCEAGDLSGLIKKHREEGTSFSPGEILYTAQQLAEGIQYLHMNKIIHRDLKPQNILITKNRKLKIADFGLAKAMQSTASQSNSQVGTLLYMAPEIVKGEKYSFKVDMWAFGCILYELCELKHPFVGNHFESLINNILNKSYQKINQKYPKYLECII